MKRYEIFEGQDYSMQQGKHGYVYRVRVESFEGEGRAVRVRVRRYLNAEDVSPASNSMAVPLSRIKAPWAEHAANKAAALATRKADRFRAAMREKGEAAAVDEVVGILGVEKRRSWSASIDIGPAEARKILPVLRAAAAALAGETAAEAEAASTTAAARAAIRDARAQLDAIEKNLVG